MLSTIIFTLPILSVFTEKRVRNMPLISTHAVAGLTFCFEPEGDEIADRDATLCDSDQVGHDCLTDLFIAVRLLRSGTP